MAASSAVLVSLEEYLHTSYRPDRDWIDGEVKERNVGEQPHAGVQGFLVRLLGNRGLEWNVWALPEQRVEVSAKRYRVPDVCAVRRDSGYEAIVRRAPLLCIEILSRDDRMSEILARVEDYLAMGVEAVWVIDPWRRRAYTAVRPGSLEGAGEALTVGGTAIRVAVGEIWAELDAMGCVGAEGEEPVG
ncbi:MAG: Uma2 family endonuclease [Acidobacteriota bacterium]|nr:Uma2 family endonuclease [Acidobacteriota bacterium]